MNLLPQDIIFNKSNRTSFIISMLFIVSCTYDKAELPPPPPPPVINLCDTLNVTYSGTIASIMNANCNASGCHSAGSPYGDFTNYSGVKAKVDNTTFKERVIIQKNMPPSYPLSQGDLDKLNCWLEAGALNN